MHLIRYLSTITVDTFLDTFYVLGIYLLKVNNRNNTNKKWNMFKVNNKDTTATRSVVFIANFEHISIVNFKKVNTGPVCLEEFSLPRHKLSDNLVIFNSRWDTVSS